MGGNRSICHSAFPLFYSTSGEMKLSTSTVAALFSRMALTGERIAYGRYGFAIFPSISVSTVGVDGARNSRQPVDPVVGDPVRQDSDKI